MFLASQIDAFKVALQLLTLIPVSFKQYPKLPVQGASILYYPVVGVLIGLILYLSAIALSFSALYNVQAGILLVIWVGVTGGLHLDGLADTADGWLGGLGDKQKTLAIMKDSHIGANAAVILFLSLLLKWCALAAILEQNTLFYLLLIPAIARGYGTLLLAYTPYAHPDGMASTLLKYQPRKALFWLSVLGGLALLSASWVWFSVSGLLFILLRHAYLLRLQGTSGDTTGAMIELMEAALLLCACFSQP